MGEFNLQIFFYLYSEKRTLIILQFINVGINFLKTNTSCLASLMTKRREWSDYILGVVEVEAVVHAASIERAVCGHPYHRNPFGQSPIPHSHFPNIPTTARLYMGARARVFNTFKTFHTNDTPSISNCKQYYIRSTSPFFTKMAIK